MMVRKARICLKWRLWRTVCGGKNGFCQGEVMGRAGHVCLQESEEASVKRQRIKLFGCVQIERWVGVDGNRGWLVITEF